MEDCNRMSLKETAKVKVKERSPKEKKIKDKPKNE